MILVTGANGFLGSYICKELLQAGHDLRVIIREGSDTGRIDDIMPMIDTCKADLLDLPALDMCFQDVSVVVHSGAQISFQGNDCDDLIFNNVESTRNVVNLSLKYNVKKLVHISSTAAIGRVRPDEVLDEETQWQESKYTSCYGKSKYLSELEVWRAASEGLNVSVLNPSVILGRNTRGEGSGQLLEYASEEHRFYPTGDLNYVDVRDVARITAVMADRDYRNDKFIINAGSIAYKDFFRSVAEFCGINPPPEAAEGWKLKLALYGDILRSIFTGKQRMLSREMIRSSSSRLFFDNRRVIEELNYSFIPLPDTLKWIYSGKDAQEKK